MNEKKIDIIDFAVASIYIILGMFIWGSYNSSLLEQSDINMLLMGLTYMGPLLLFLAYYKRFRITSVSIMWFCIGFLQWFSVMPFKENTDFNAVIGSYADNDSNLIILMVLVSIFRIISLWFYKQEVMVITNFSPRDNRTPIVLDYLFTFIILIFLAAILSII